MILKIQRWTWYCIEWAKDAKRNSLTGRGYSEHAKTHPPTLFSNPLLYTDKEGEGVRRKGSVFCSDLNGLIPQSGVGGGGAGINWSIFTTVGERAGLQTKK